MDNVFCTVLSKLRVYQGMALYKSLLHNSRSFKIYFLCMDEETYSICSKLNLDHGVLIKVEEIENQWLRMKKSKRALNEYCWTLKPYFIEYVLNRHQSADCATYIDADMCFFNDPSVIYKDTRNWDVLLSEHGYASAYKAVEEACGRYNSGFIIFRNTENAQRALRWWQEKCLEWCHDQAREGKFGDQKYLDHLPFIFENVYSIKTPGVNIAPWNENRYSFKSKDGKIYVNEKKLICYHFSGFRIVSNDKAALVLGERKIYDLLHYGYIHVLKRVIKDIENVAPEFKGFSIEQRFSDQANYVNF